MQKDSGKNASEDAGTDLLDGAYALKTPADNCAYYQRFAATYDQDFAAGLGYVYPKAVADAFLDLKDLPEGPVCDIGCGTGLVASHLKARRTDMEIDGADISPDMLAVAADKSLYQNLYEVDLTGDITSLPTGYAAIISAGTFTHGHLGPEPLRQLIRHCQDGGVFCIGVNQQHYQKHDFALCLESLVADNVITLPDLLETAIYARKAGKHNGDLALICQFRVVG
ncbi:MAG: methyltransferase domain-containing protein [Pseudomonadota bacterium]|nr:methyltransferase domain-containing protein [Pseudomonadota bacterium]